MGPDQYDTSRNLTGLAYGSLPSPTALRYPETTTVRRPREARVSLLENESLQGAETSHPSGVALDQLPVHLQVCE